MHIKKKDEYINIMVVPNSKSDIRSIKIKKSAFKAAIIAAMIFLLGIFSSAFYFAGKYTYLYATIKEKDNIISEKNKTISLKDQKIAEMKDLNEAQDKKIAMLNDNAKKINDKMKSLDELEQKVRRMVGLSTQKTSRGGITRDSRSLMLDEKTTNELSNEIDNKTYEYKTLIDDINKRLDYLASLPSAYPVTGSITSPFGSRTSPYGESSEFHPGIDIAVGYGTPVKAAGKGVVTYAGWLSGYGNVVMINHGYGITSVYGHNSQLLVKVGQTVNRGDIIAKSGSTGRSTGPHVHFEIRLNGNPVDPLKYLGK